jgi:hypothetical protein
MNSRFGAVFVIATGCLAGGLKAVPAGAIKLAIRPTRCCKACGRNGEDAGTSTTDFGEDVAGGGRRGFGRSTTWVG